MENSLEGKAVIIAGAAGGLGAVASAAFAEAGANLVLLGREQAKLDDLRAELRLAETKTLTRAIDVTNREDLEQLAKAAEKKFGGIDILLNFVGGWIGGKNVIDANKTDYQSMLDQHLYSSLAMLQALMPYMLKRKWGRIIAISSPNASRPPGKNSPYAVGKSALEALMLSLAQELKGSGVTANLVLVRAIDVKHERQINPSEENKGWTSPEEISATLLHLCSEEAVMSNGARIPLFGEPF